MANRRSDNNSPISGEVASPFDLVKRFGPPALMGLVAFLFVVQNTDSTRFNFLWMEFEWPLWVMLLVFSAVGAIVFWFIARSRRKRKSAD